MSYKILYDPEQNHKFPKCRKFSLPVKWTAAALLILLLFGWVAKPVNNWVHSGCRTAALDTLVEDLESGEPMVEAFADFCVTIINHENIPE